MKYTTNPYSDVADSFHPTNASYYRRELKKAQADIAELKALRHKAEIDRQRMYDDRELLREKLDKWESQEPVLQVGSPTLFWLCDNDKRPPCGTRLIAIPKDEA